MLRSPSPHNLLLFCCWLGIALSSAHGGQPVGFGKTGVDLNRTANSEFLAVDYVAAHSPAAQAGIKMGDLVTAINGVTTRGVSRHEGLKSLDGDIGAEIKLTIRRTGPVDQQLIIVRQSFIDVYSQAATEGDIFAQYNLGVYYYDAGNDLPKAAEWFRKAGDAGYLPAQTRLAYMYQLGQGVAKDPAAAAGWLSKAAAQGDAWAEENLAEQYFWGEGVQQNDRTAFAWYYSAAQQDDPAAARHLGFLYREGRGVARNYQESFAWYQRSAQLNNPYGEWGLGYMYSKGLGVDKAPAKALWWYRTAQAGLPNNEVLKEDVASAAFSAFLKSPEVISFDPALLPPGYVRRAWIIFGVLATIYIAGSVFLFLFTLRTSNVPPRLPVAVGWVLFNPLSQTTGLLGIMLFAKLFTAPLYFLMVCFFTSLPVIASSLGANRNMIWKSPGVSWKKLLLLLVLAYSACFAVSHCYHLLYALAFHKPVGPQPTVFLIAKSKHASALLTYAVVAVVAPLAEEITFRGYLFDSLRKRVSGTVAVLITACLFAGMHLQWKHFVTLFGMGAALGLLKLKTNSVRAPMLLHMINNAIATALIG